jgi:hypothetical protein
MATFFGRGDSVRYSARAARKVLHPLEASTPKIGRQGCSHVRCDEIARPRVIPASKLSGNLAELVEGDALGDFSLPRLLG